MLKNIGLISGVAELLVSIVLGVLVAFIAFRTFRRTHKELNCDQSLKDNNVAMAIVLVCDDHFLLNIKAIAAIVRRLL